ncbi:unnamed protein product [Camellia sinensis]
MIVSLGESKEETVFTMSNVAFTRESWIWRKSSTRFKYVGCSKPDQNEADLLAPRKKMSGKHTHIGPGTWRISCSFHSLVAVLVAVFIISVFYTTRVNKLLVEDHQEASIENKMLRNGHQVVSKNGSWDSLQGCNLFSGKWVYDDKSFPLYKELECSFIDDGMACERFGRRDFNYQHWRWQPHDCDLPRLVQCHSNVGGTKGEKACICWGFIEPEPMGFNGLFGSVTNSSLTQIHDYQWLINLLQGHYFYWAPLLVESNSDDFINHRIPDRIVRVQAIEKHARYWTDADILVFNSYIWWRRPKLKVLWGSFGSSDGIYKEVEMLRSYELALRTWSDWLDIHINRTKTKLFFTSMSPTHERAEEWGMPPNQKCNNETEPISKGHCGIDSDPRMMRVVEATIDELKARGLKVQMLNITQLSEYRKDAHPSIYRKIWGSKEEQSNPIRDADCLHWCLPGVPDVWNLLLYAYIFYY